MDPERVPPLPQSSQITSPVRVLDNDTSGSILSDPFNPSRSNVPRTTARIDTSNLNPYAGNVLTESPSPDNLEVTVSSKKSSPQHTNELITLRSLYNHLYLLDFTNQILKKGKLE